MFGLCNSSQTLQHCVLPIFADMVEASKKVFMYDLSVIGDTYEERF